MSFLALQITAKQYNSTGHCTHWVTTLTTYLWLTVCMKGRVRRVILLTGPDQLLPGPSSVRSVTTVLAEWAQVEVCYVSAFVVVTRSPVACLLSWIGRNIYIKWQWSNLATTQRFVRLDIHLLCIYSVNASPEQPSKYFPLCYIVIPSVMEWALSWIIVQSTVFSLVYLVIHLDSDSVSRNN